ncbi:MAG: cytochrome c oxidase subunit II [bacterium]
MNLLRACSRTALSVVACSLLAFSSNAFAEYGLNMTEGVTEFSHRAYSIHMLVLWICVVIGVLVFGAMFISMYKHRKSQGAKAATFSHSTKAEIIWTIIPIVILVFVAFPATKAVILMEAQPADPEMTIKVTGFQWRWKYDYLEDGVSFISSLDAKSNAARQIGSGIDPATVENYLLNVDNEVVIPSKTQIKFLLTADDVIHSWWVPALGWKRDAIPGFINEGWTYVEQEGVYRGQCAELCGRDHGFMPIVVRVVSKEEYATWVAKQKQIAKQQTITNTSGV